MGLWSLVSSLGRSRRLFRGRRQQVQSEIRQLQAGRFCRFEAMEERRLLDADPIKIGITYFEGDGGSDLQGDTFQVMFEGGAANTELTRLVIDGDHAPAGLSFADMIFDTVKGGLGADEAYALQVTSSTGIDNVTWQVADGGTSLVFEFRGFNAGEKLVFSVDVDEVQDFDPAETDINRINEGIDPIASGVEFQGSKFSADFHAPHYRDTSGGGEFRNQYDALFTGTTLLVTQGTANGLPNDNAQGQRDRSTGALASLQQVPLPVTIGGRVFADNNRNLVQDGSDFGISGVSMALWRKDGGQWAFTGHTTTTNAQGDYQFGASLNLQPGEYEVRETQPSGFFSVGAIPGKVSGATTGTTVAGNPDVLTSISLPLGDLHGVNYDFAEAQPASIRGRVHLTDREGNCFSEEALNSPLAGVKITLKDAAGNVVATQLTNQNGEYAFEALLPRVYTIIEETPAGLIDGADHIGTIGGVKIGSKSTNDVISNITLNGGQAGVSYDFCEHLPSSLAGFVYHDVNNNGLRESGEAPIGGTTVILLDAGGTQVATTTTDNSGFYKFANLAAGTYRIREVQPSGWLDGKDTAGTILGQVVGTAQNPGDQLSGVTLLWGDDGVEYNFGELLPGSIRGKVTDDPDCASGCDCEEGETGPAKPIAGVTIELLDQGGTVIRTTTTDADGRYAFTDLAPGIYAVRELQPAGYLQGTQKIGSGGGDASVQDLLSQISIDSGDHLIDYDFCEMLPVSISGLVWLDTIRNCEIDQGEAKLGGVTIQLLDANGSVVATRVTAQDGTYNFDNLRPGVYSVRELQPAGYFEGCTQAGSLGGDDSLQNNIQLVTLHSGDNGLNYNFSEVPAGSLSGFVFRDGPPISSASGQIPDNLYELRDGKLTADDLRIKGVTLELRYTLTGEPVRGEDLLPGTYPPGAVRTVTNASGYYEFIGLPAGNYSVFEVQPSGYIDSLDTPGTTNGLAVNIGTLVSPLLIQAFAAAGVNFRNDAILQVPLAAGQHSEFNNFSEVQIVPVTIVPPPLETPEPPPPPVHPFLLVFPELPPQPLLIEPAKPGDIVTGGGAEFTWHLSVIDAGLPRVAARSTKLDGLAFKPATWIEKTEWSPERMRDGAWHLHGASDPAPHALFGLVDGIPVVGDFNGDGRDDVAVFYKGEWFLDLNGNGQWDAEDLWAKLGTEHDRPVTGDWDGDGKDDIGIFGPKWSGDTVHMDHEPGLPDQDNRRAVKQRAKNVPPTPEEATDGERLLRLTSQGKERADLIDHVFQFGNGQDVPIAGDWNGDGIRSIGVFRDGKWHFDMDGDGEWSKGDKTAEFGEKGDLPVVGDFNGDGIEEIAVFRGGKWIIDTNGNREIDAADRVIEFGRAGDKPIAGDFDGDGTDEPGVYRGQ